MADKISRMAEKWPSTVAIKNVWALYHKEWLSTIAKKMAELSVQKIADKITKWLR
jgi:hypothetical protein